MMRAPYRQRSRCFFARQGTHWPLLFYFSPKMKANARYNLSRRLRIYARLHQRKYSTNSSMIAERLSFPLSTVEDVSIECSRFFFRLIWFIRNDAMLISESQALLFAESPTLPLIVMHSIFRNEPFAFMLNQTSEDQLV